MPQTQIACPRCRQMITANIEQLFDVTQDPQAKQRLLGGVSNMARCPHCGYQGRLATPIVYHDNEKELLLTFFPPELNMQLNEQERLIGPLIKQVTDRLQPEKRKGYLLKPVPNLTYESMIQTILSKDGITPEMLKEQQERVQVIERLLQASSRDVRSESLDPLWNGWDRPGNANAWRYWSASSRSEFVRENSGRVLANLHDDKGEYMRCRFTLINPDRGMKGGGEGRCQLSDSGKEINAEFPRQT